MSQTAPAHDNAPPHPPPGVNIPEGALPNREQLMAIFQIPGVMEKFTEQALKDPEAAAQALSLQNLQAAALLANGHPLPPGVSFPPGLNDPGPSSHPRGPPNLGQLTAAAMQAAAPPPPPPPPQDSPDPEPAKKDAPATNRRSRGGAAMGTDEWTRQRKDNHKEVERRRRGNINEGINELGRIVPNGSGEKAKGAILSRAVQYIHHLKENEARNIEKWTLEKLLMDQAMGDLQAQLEEVRRMWEEERHARQRAEQELELLRGGGGSLAPGQKRPSEDADGDGEKRQRTE